MEEKIWTMVKQLEVAEEKLDQPSSDGDTFYQDEFSNAFKEEIHAWVEEKLEPLAHANCKGEKDKEAF